MGSSASTPVAEDQINDTTTGGIHMVEFHVPTMGAGVLGLAAMGGTCYLLYRCVRRARRHQPAPSSSAAPPVSRNETAMVPLPQPVPMPLLQPNVYTLPRQVFPEPHEAPYVPPGYGAPPTFNLTIDPRFLRALNQRRREVRAAQRSEAGDDDYQDSLV